MKYLVKKIVTLIMTLFLVSVLAFLAFQIIPGDVVTSILGTEATPEREEALRKELGLDQPPVVRYVRWAGAVLKGDFGESYRYSKNMNQMMPVAELIGDKLPVTLLLAALSMLIIIVVAIPLGVFWARSKNKILDVSLNMGTQTAMAIPSFFLGVLVTYLFGFVLKWFAPGGYVSFRDDLWGCIRYLIFPAISVAIPKIAMTARFLRNSMLTERSSDYVRTAFSKGASERRVSYVHVLRNAMMPVVTFLGMIIAEIVAGSIVVEQVFSLPGIGKLLISSISTRDFPVVEILILYITFVVIFVYFLVDILYRVIDPRISSK
ncbi:MAG: ABC transporter permease [Lachnospiraceae bacterium]|jgi:ABC-type dipeptide/oligopeptide/nickel transport system permease component|nr:ABC transporter permease [Lachnospiraceae bacterium]MBR6150111.1 ABC transporter permease [Lachnospiraceae bacterium]